MIEKYRKGVGIFLINDKNEVWVGKRFDYKNDYWQMPQGGIDDFETEEERHEKRIDGGNRYYKKNYTIIGIQINCYLMTFPKDLK